MLAMNELDNYLGISVSKPAGCLFGAIDGAMLSAGAAEGDTEVCEIPFKVFVNTLAYNVLYV